MVHEYRIHALACKYKHWRYVMSTSICTPHNCYIFSTLRTSHGSHLFLPFPSNDFAVLLLNSFPATFVSIVNSRPIQFVLVNYFSGQAEEFLHSWFVKSCCPSIGSGLWSPQ